MREKEETETVYCDVCGECVDEAVKIDLYSRKPVDVCEDCKYKTILALRT